MPGRASTRKLMQWWCGRHVPHFHTSRLGASQLPLFWKCFTWTRLPSWTCRAYTDHRPRPSSISSAHARIFPMSLPAWLLRLLEGLQGSCSFRARSEAWCTTSCSPIPNSPLINEPETVEASEPFHRSTSMISQPTCLSCTLARRSG